MRRGSRWFVALACALFVGSGAALPASASDAPAVIDVCGDAGNGDLVRLSDDTEPIGTPILLVHGFLSTSIDDAGTRHIATSPFARAVVWADGTGAAASDVRSLETRLDALPNTTVYAFDYSRLSSEWIGDSGVTSRLAEAIECLAEESGQDVGIIAHSMGGLAMRAVLADEPEIAASISEVVAVATPNLGSEAADMLDTGATIGRTALARAPLSVSLAVSAFMNECITELDTDARSGCDIPPALRTIVAGASDAGAALRTGSEALADLAPWPDTVDVHAVVGSATVRLRIGDAMPAILSPLATGLRLAGVELPAAIDQTLQLGDGMVLEDSAIDGADSEFVVRCSATADFTGASGLEDSQTLFDRLGASGMIGLVGPCAHDSLFENGAIVGDIVAQFAPRLGRVP